MGKFRLKFQLEEAKYDIVVQRLLECISYWNRESDENATGHWLMNKIYGDCEYVMSYAHELAECSKGTYEFGRAGSHIWLHRNGERILMIHSHLENCKPINK